MKLLPVGMILLVLSSCELATTDQIVDDKKTVFAMNLIRDQGYRCQRITSIEAKANVEGWSVVCHAKSYDTQISEWSYEITLMPRGWIVSPWKINSELPQRCQAHPDQECSSP